MKRWLPLVLLLPACGGPAFSTSELDTTTGLPSDSGPTSSKSSADSASTDGGSPLGASSDDSSDGRASPPTADDSSTHTATPDGGDKPIPSSDGAADDGSADSCATHDTFLGTTGYSPVQTLSETTPKACRCDYSCACLMAESSFCSIAGASIASCTIQPDSIINLTCGS